MLRRAWNGRKECIADFRQVHPLFPQAVYNNDTKTFAITTKNPSEEVYISIQDNGTNFAGAFGINRFFDGNDARDMYLAQRYREDPTLIHAFREAVDGNFVVANKMQQLQFDKVTFTNYKGEEHYETISGYFRYIAGKVASDTQATQTTQMTKEAVYSVAKQEYKAISEVSVDDELVNLIKFQRERNLLIIVDFGVVII